MLWILQQLRDIVTNLLSQEPSKRPTASAILEQGYLKFTAQKLESILNPGKKQKSQDPFADIMEDLDKELDAEGERLLNDLEKLFSKYNKN